jgi:hypothetical protein
MAPRFQIRCLYLTIAQLCWRSAECKFDSLKETIKEEMPDWLATVARYDDPSITDMEADYQGVAATRRAS